ncbi:SDR family NAD(P)-dependent oxidoreductase [Gammaproteobacteria bacterium]|nr:SDR family NAD(P)-dependent oxidoreductase [Gammaproteobacteria bacterium]
MDFQIKNKTAIVCASSQGLGKAAALELASEGVNLVISSRNEEKLLSVKKRNRKYNKHQNSEHCCRS